MKKLLLFFCIAMLMNSCKKQSIVETLPKEQDERAQIIWLENNRNSLETLELSDFDKMNVPLQKMVYTRLSAEKQSSLWIEKLSSQHAQANAQQLQFLQKFEKILTPIFFKEKMTKEKKAVLDGYVLEGLKLFEYETFKNLTTTISLGKPVVNILPNASTMLSCKCAVGSDFCSSGKVCIAPKSGENCDPTNSDTVCGFLLLFSCDGRCLSKGTGIGPVDTIEEY